MMKKLMLKFVAAAALGALALTGVASAQQKFDGAKFFDEIANRGVNTKGIDGNKFFEEIANRGVNSKNPIDGAKFFEELSNRGVNTKGIDGNKFFEELSNRGVKLPEMVTIKK
jgi:hypothetical protein